MEKNKVLPAGWTEAKLGEICSIKTGDKDVNEGSLNGEYPFFTCSKDVYRFATYSFEGKAILVAGNGNFNIKKYCGKFEAYQRTYVLQNFGSDYDYLYYYLSGNLDELTKDNRGSTVRYIRIGNLTEFNVRIPPMNEQHRIVEKLEELFSELDAGVKALKTAQEQLKVYRKAVLKDAFEGKFTDNTPMFVKSLGDLVEEPKYGTSKRCFYEKKGKAVLRIPNIGNGVIDKTDLKYAQFDEREIQSLSLKKGDILIIRSNGSLSIVGNVAIVEENDVDCLFAGYLIRIRLLDKNFNPRYLLYYLLSPEARRYVEFKAKSTSGVNNINAQEIKEIKVPICSPEDQKAIVQEIETRLSICDKFEETIEQSLAKAEALRQSLLQRAFAGKLVAQDTNDEPACKLLERIRLASENEKSKKTSAKGRTKK